jgi:hypothetical protein
VHNAALTKFNFVGAELLEDVREERHEKNLLPRGLAYNTLTRRWNHLAQGLHDVDELRSHSDQYGWGSRGHVPRTGRARRG